MTLPTYLPQDRLRALARGETLPDRATGAALFLDISGFTALTESLQATYGARRGSEELTRQMEAVYSALIAPIETHGGSVISFAGDSMLCWFDDAHGSAPPRAAASAFALQSTMAAMEAGAEKNRSVLLTLKVAIASGAARRFVVGNPAIQLLDALAGATIARVAAAEHLARQGEVVLDGASVQALGEALAVQEWRTDPETQEQFAVIRQFSGPTPAPALPPLARPPVDSELRPWLHAPVFERAQRAQGSFLTEFRPCVALFVRFAGIDYDSEAAEAALDSFIRAIQSVASRYGGTLVDLTIGDKGSYAYVNFGALSAHEDDSRRAVKAALELGNRTELQLQMGITQGLMRVGAYGGETRKVFGALGDDVNLAARLMMTARADEILVSSHVHKAVRDHFTFEPRPPLPMKGKAEPLPVFAMTGAKQKRAVRLQEPNYALPMVGRTAELQLITAKLDLAQAGQGQVIGIVAEAGLGKSRLVAEVIRQARRKGFVGFGGACQSDGLHTPYLAWKPIWQAFFDVDPEMPERKRMRLIEGEIEDRAPARVEAMPLLSVVLDLNLPENDFTRNLEPKVRQSALHALLEDCLKAQAGDEPTLIVIEDLHWIDALSHDLLEGLARALARHAVCFVLAYRPPELERLQAPRLEALEQFTRVELHVLTTAEAESAIRAKLAQLYPARGGALPQGLVAALMARAQGNPFYLEELLNYVRDRGLDPADIENIELPDSLHTLILSRIDQLSEGEKTTLRVASIVGRLFRASWLTGYYPALGPLPQVKAALDALEKLDITPLDSPEPELAYLFKHIVTHEVTYESLPFATRARLHEQLARFLESAYPEAPPLEALAFHYGRSENQEKQREYLRKAGEAAQRRFANEAAVEAYSALLPLLKDEKEQTQIHLKRGEVSALMGNYDDAESDYRAALDNSKDDLALQASAQYALGKLNRLRGEYEPALDWLGRAREARRLLEDTAGLAQVLIETGVVLYNKGEHEQAREPLITGLSLARDEGDQLYIALALNHLGNVAWSQGNYSAAQTLHEESLGLRREMNDKGGISSSLNNLGLVAAKRGDIANARRMYEESQKLDRDMGDKSGTAGSLNNLGRLLQAQGDHPGAQMLYEESLALRREMGDKAGISQSLVNLGRALQAQGDLATAKRCYQESLALDREMDDKPGTANVLLSLGLLSLAENSDEARQNIIHSLRLWQASGEQLNQTSSLIGAAGLALHEGNPQFAAQLLGSVESALKALNAVAEPEVKFFHADTLAKVREVLGEAAFPAAWEAGSQWSLEVAVQKALEA